MLASRPAISVLPVVGLQKWFFSFEIVGMVFRVMMLGIGALIYNNEFLAVAGFGVAGMILYVWLMLKVGLRVKHYV
ncbi:hypothetical protein AAV32_07260 [Kerstersia gyiorum]|uniref:Uncharacterized protein n=2 Tax=Kerstersia gyiorum TaxID=206506 RepID=A0A171KTM4_9BURK|nr:hypothetical protein AAV32_07260 [Kerstersia gyiorum]